MQYGVTSQDTDDLGWPVLERRLEEHVTGFFKAQSQFFIADFNINIGPGVNLMFNLKGSVAYVYKESESIFSRDQTLMGLYDIPLFVKFSLFVSEEMLLCITGVSNILVLKTLMIISRYSFLIIRKQFHIIHVKLWNFSFNIGFPEDCRLRLKYVGFYNYLLIKTVYKFMVLLFILT